MPHHKNKNSWRMPHHKNKNSLRIPHHRNKGQLENPTSQKQGTVGGKHISDLLPGHEEAIFQSKSQKANLKKYARTFRQINTKQAKIEKSCQLFPIQVPDTGELSVDVHKP